MVSTAPSIRTSFQRGFAKGWRGFLWMLKIILPISLLTFLLDYSGWLGQVDGLLEPLMKVIHLPAMAALPLIVGMLTGIYGAIAAMSVLPFTAEQMTLMAVFLLIAHNLIQEGMVQRQSGFSLWTATAVRLSAAVLTVFVLGWIMGPETMQKVAGGSVETPRMAFRQALLGWAGAMAWLSLKILAIITVLMVFMEVMRQYHLTDRLMGVIDPFLGLLGLDRQVGVLWLTAAVFGIAYGGAVIVEEARERRIAPEQLKPLHVSIGVNHAMVEDPSLFLPLGLHPFWLWIPRLVTAMAFTHTYRLWRWIWKRRRSITVNAASTD